MTAQSATAHFRGLSDEARQAIIEHRRTMREQREFVAANRHRIDEIWEAIPCPPLTIAEHLASLSPERREHLEQEWNNG